ncbi:YicC/YloC family endoribonuclease [Chryseobacterium sp. SC28]|uniref:YicC/YloC family endoribonuclease n=1 Tax=Chryseobacterium sp. SC28 TaxID=2268028 RepID=UPI000F6544BB|nr:YicC/YloC family endoribonuclease [Chryseobacterium sp. SC28]RRQ45868.1 YicC family protein [Chryseobacterium sp. SC28]
MILSMTGFGRAETAYEGTKITVDIKSLNSKNFDLNIKIPLRYKEKEFEIRKLLNDKILRGKVDCYINCENLEDGTDVTINPDIVKNYMQQLRAIASHAPEFEYLKMAVRMPDVLATKNAELDENEWKALQEVVQEAVSKFIEFRQTEGHNLAEEIEKIVQNIENNLNQVAQYEEERIQPIKERYQSALKNFDNIDETRFYQEMVYFVEKLDISEEKVRLSQHIKYYLEVMRNEDYNGKKLGFVAQEMGREINTLGSKANHSEIQKLVVEMKDDLEKIKEQTLNVL